MNIPNIEIKNTSNRGKGVYSLVHFAPNQIILKFNGKVISKDIVDTLPSSVADDYLQIGEKIYLDLKGDISKFINHSCNPNTAIKIVNKFAFLITTRAIIPNEELLFDYSITSNEGMDSWSMKCKCGSWNCRGIISGFNALSDKDKIKYLKLGIVPKYIK